MQPQLPNFLDASYKTTALEFNRKLKSRMRIVGVEYGKVPKTSLTRKIKNRLISLLSK